MKKDIEIRNVKIGPGIPKICISLIGKSDAALIEEAKFLKTLDLDIVEWRMDYHEEVENIEKMKATLKVLRTILEDTPILTTFRSKKEGGVREISSDSYVKLNKALITTGEVDIIDVELFIGDDIVKEIVEFAHNHNTKVIISNHDFDKTPTQEEIINRLCKMQELDADIPKIAVMPQTVEDVLTLLSATNKMVTKYADRPIITMSMSGLGAVSRLSGEIFGSALTFAAAKTASAPGQIPIDELKQTLEVIHQAK